MSATAPTDATGRRFATLDGYRGLAALVVCVYHVLGRSTLAADHPGIDAWTARLGNYGVTVFFLLSGFLLYRPFALAHLRGSAPPALGPYAVRRLARIVPGYWFALTALFVVFRDDELRNAGDTVTYYGFVQIYRRGGYAIGGLGQAWSLCVEVGYYLFLPALAFLFARRWRAAGSSPRVRLAHQLQGLALLYGFGVAFRWWALHQWARWPTAEVWLPGWFDLFALGMLLAVGSAWVEAGGRLPVAVERTARTPWLCWLLALEAYWVLTQVHLPSAWEPETMGQTMGRPLFGGLSALFLLLPGTLGDGTTRRGAAWLASRPMVALGAISYGVYLWHTQWIELYVEWRNAGDVPDHTAVLLAFVVAATIASATFSWFVVERPFVRMAARHLARPRRPRPTPAPLVATN